MQVRALDYIVHSLKCFALLVTVLSLLGISASAHTLDEATMEAVIEKGEVKVQIRLPRPQLAEFDLNNDGRIDESELKPDAILAVLEPNLSLQADGKVQKPTLFPIQLGAPSSTHTEVGLQWTIPEKTETLKFHFDYFVESKDAPRCLASFSQNGDKESFVFSIGNTDFQLDSSQLSIGSFVFIGFEHILEGYDHILFLLVLLLAGGTFLDVFKMVTAFTLAHSLTLALAVLGIFTLPSSIVEPIILISIMVGAAENIRNDKPDNRWIMAGLFGLIHGMGFAGVLADMNLSGYSASGPLIGFNLGVELGQLAIVLVVFPGLYWVSKQEWKRKFSLVGSSIAILVSIYWLWQLVMVG